MPQSSQAFQLLDRALHAWRARVTRFSSSAALLAVLVPLSQLRSKSQKCAVKVQTAGELSENPSVLFVSSADVFSELSGLITMVGQPPDWIAVPDPPAGGLELQDKVVHPTGRVHCHDEEQKQLSFALYPLQTPIKEAKSIHPVKAKIAEPGQNLQQRARWFQNRRKIR